MTQGAVGNVTDLSGSWKIIHSTFRVLDVCIYEYVGEEFDVELRYILTE